MVQGIQNQTIIPQKQVHLNQAVPPFPHLAVERALLLLLLTALPLPKEGLGQRPKQDGSPGTKRWQDPITGSTMALGDRQIIYKPNSTTL